MPEFQALIIMKQFGAIYDNDPRLRILTVIRRFDEFIQSRTSIMQLPMLIEVLDVCKLYPNLFE
jgi:hypothetical protein